MLRCKRNIDEDAAIEVTKKRKHNEDKVNLVDFKTFKEVYESLHGILKPTKFNLRVIEEYYEKFNSFNSVEKAVYRVANFGSPNNRKSSAFNFLMTGSHDFPLPTSGRTDVEGETLKPIRCRYTTSNSLVIRKNDDGNVLKEFKDINKPAVLDFIREKMKEDDIIELTIELPRTEFKQQYETFKNFEFLDLIGMSDSNCETKLKKDKFIKLNRTAVEKEHIDAVFLFHSERKKMPRKIIEQLWMTGIFSDLTERSSPKLVNAMKIMKNKDWSNEQELEDIFRGFESNSSITKLEMQKTVCELFNFADIPDSPEYNELRKHVESLPTNTCDFQILEIENKAESVRELISRADSVCILDMVGNEPVAYESKYHASFLTKFVSIKKEIIRFKNEHLFNEARDYMLPVCEELLKKIQVFQNSKSIYKDSNKTYLQMKDYMQKRERNNRLLRSAKKDVDDLCNTFFTDRLLNFDDSEENDYGESHDHDVNENVQAINNKKRIKEMFSILLLQIAKVHTQLQTDTSEEIKKIYARSNSSAPRTEVVVASKMIYHLIKKHQIDIIKNMLLNKDIDRICSQIKEIIIKLHELLEETFYQGFFIEIPDQLKNDFNENINQDIEKLKRIKSYIIENKTEKKVSSNQPNYFPKPILFQTKGSNKLPGSNKPIEIEDIRKYFKFNHSSNTNQLNSLLNEGKAKSQLEIVPKECEQTDHVQFHIERESQTILVEYNGNFIQKKVDNLHKRINQFEKDKISKSLYPIFISSRLRRNKDQGYIDVNIIAKDLLADEANFLIFLFIEAGDEQNRHLFKNEIEYYKGLKKRNCPCQNDEDCPIILCYLPEKDLGIGRKRKIMMMFAEHLMLRRWYFLDDDIDSFHEYDRLGHCEYKTSKHSTFKALNFMKVVLEDSISNDEQISQIDKQKIKEWLKGLGFNINSKPDGALFERLYDILLALMSEGNLNESKNETLDIVNKLLNGHPDNLTLIEIKNHLLNDNSKIIGQVALWNKLAYNSEDYGNRLRGEKPNKTHIISKKRYQVVLYNLDAIKGIHPVSDNVLFEPTLIYEERKKLVTSAKSQSFKDGPVCEAARSGYKCSDKAHVLYQILNSVSGFLLYFFSFETLKCPSKVDEEDNEA